MDTRGAWSEAVRDRQTAAPGFGNDVARERGQKWLGVAVRDWKDRNLGDGRCLGDRVSFRVFGGADARSEWIAAIGGHIGDAAALNAVAWTHRPFGEDVAVSIPMFARIGINQAPDCAVPRRDFRFDAPPGPAVFRDDDSTLDRHAMALELLVVGRHTVIHEHEWAGHIAVDRVRVVR